MGDDTEGGEEQFRLGSVIAERFTILSAPLKGGMALVFRARDEHCGGRTVALKVARPESNPKIAALAFQREYEALDDLKHENIVALIDAGREGQTSYLVLEWLEESLTHRIRNTSAYDWPAYYADLGRPVLLALNHAHRRNRAHRDLKPDNLLFDAYGQPKIVDFGIARAMRDAQVGETLRHAGSVPYTPPEPDDGIRSQSRDAYSWAVITASCLAGKIFSDLGALNAALATFDQRNVPVSILKRATSDDPKQRYLSSLDLLADVDSFEHQRTSKEQITVHLELSNRAVRMLASHWPGKDQEELGSLLSNDLAAGNAVQSIQLQESQGLRIVGATLEAHCRRVSRDAPRLRVEEVIVLGIDRAESFRREMPVISSLEFQCSPPAVAAQSLNALRSFEARVRVYEAMHERDIERQRKERWLDCWSAILREKERIIRAHRASYTYSGMRKDGRFYIATCDGEIDEATTPDSLIIQRPDAPVLLFKVYDVLIDEIVLELQGTYHDQVPLGGGTLEYNHVAQRRAILRQRSALDRVRQDTAASPHLREVLCTPSVASPPSLSGLPNDLLNLSPDKYEVLEKGLGVQSFLAVEGPPGTGKTTLIAELIAIYLDRNPTHRILLSSQTHIALDHVIDKLVQKGLSDEVVRIHGDQSQKVSPSILPLTLENKTKHWVEITEGRARAFLSSLAADLGVQRDHVEIALLGKQRQGLASQISSLEAQLSVLENQLEAQNAAQVHGEEEQSGQDMVDETATTLDQHVQLSEVIEALRTKRRRVDSALEKLGDFGKELVAATEAESSDWIALLDAPKTEAGDRFVRLLELQMRWLSRLGPSRDFTPAVLGQARIVAGTCVGLGGLLEYTKQTFDLCIIDETSKATPTETLVPMAYSKKWILVGDPKQLPPFEDAQVISAIEGYTAEEVKATMLDIFLRDGPEECCSKLVEQRRMAGGIGSLVSEVFYGGSLKTIRSENDRHQAIAALFPRSVVWLSTSSQQCAEVEQPGRTFKNPTECAVIAGLLQQINDAMTVGGASPVKVAVISAYSAQVRAIRVQTSGFAGKLTRISLEINTVDAFQGRDADICIYSVTRSNSDKKLGFQRETRRLNVALSRGRDALIVVGDHLFCRSIHHRNPFLDVLSHIECHPDTCEVHTVERR